MAGSAPRLTPSHKEGDISQGHFALKSPLELLHLFSFIPKINVPSLQPIVFKVVKHNTHCISYNGNLSYNGNVNEALSSDVMRAAILVSEWIASAHLVLQAHMYPHVHSEKNFHY